MNKPTLYIMCGLSGSGKSTIAAQIANENPNTIIVSSDAIREELTGNYEDQEHNEEVFKIFHNRIRKNLENKKNVIADATNLTMKSRRAIMMKVNGLEVHKVCVIIPKPFEQCKIDNKNREHPVPNEVLDKQIRRFQIPFCEEKFDEIQINVFYKENRLTLGEMFSMMEGFDQKNPHHTMDLYNHSFHTYELFSSKCYPAKYNISALLHDFGKMYCQTFDENGIAHYYEHHAIGSYLILENLSGIFYEDIGDICFLINYHMMPFNWDTDKAKQRWKERFGEYKYKMLLDFNECDRAR